MAATRRSWQFALAMLAVGEGPCDLYDAGDTPCVAAHSTVRALYASYDGALYQLARYHVLPNASKAYDFQDVKVEAAGGFADVAAHDAFCNDYLVGPSRGCDIMRIYDQSPRQNHLDPAPGGAYITTPDAPVNASRLHLVVGGHRVYGAYFDGGKGYRNEHTSGVATGDEPESMYMVVAGKHVNGMCCFDYGNAQTDGARTHETHNAGNMEALYWGTDGGTAEIFSRGTGHGPWVMADLESGIWGGNKSWDAENAQNEAIDADFVTAMLKGEPGRWALKGGDAQTGPLKTLFEGNRPNLSPHATGDYKTMRKRGGIVLGIGGDNNNFANGTFFEGVMTKGYSSDATDDAVHANIVAAGYGLNSSTLVV
eukprot:TRINITY_DN45448_c0_g1_i1.p1 TRINITY_DN45448_c0_g1~~TRINITY_DN45448_c0_g1_i1.p1  ORF type:complete len:388 (+),score=57.02 TRINITY_DN45448_c0_g1_i1:61-1164(+)